MSNDDMPMCPECGDILDDYGNCESIHHELTDLLELHHERRTAMNDGVIYLVTEESTGQDDEGDGTKMCIADVLVPTDGPDDAQYPDTYIVFSSVSIAAEYASKMDEVRVKYVALMEHPNAIGVLGEEIPSACWNCRPSIGDDDTFVLSRLPGLDDGIEWHGHANGELSLHATANDDDGIVYGQDIFLSDDEEAALLQLLLQRQAERQAGEKS